MKILVLRFSSIGDIVLTSPVLRCLKQQLGAEIHFLTKKAYASIVATNPNVDKVLSFQKEVTEVLPLLKIEAYDWIIDLHNNLRSNWVKLALRRPSRAFNKLNFEKWLLVWTGLNRLPDIHIVDRYMATVRHLDVQYDGKGLDYFIPPSEEVNLRDIAPKLKPENYVVFVIGANHATKRLPIEKITVVCRMIMLPVVLLGGKTELEAAKRIAEQAGAHVVNCCGSLSLHQSASVVRQSLKVITHDTGMMHIAAAYHKEIVSIWGNTIPAFGMYPFYPLEIEKNTSLQIKGLNCRPCSKIGYQKCPKGHFRCMNELDPVDIYRAIK